MYQMLLHTHSGLRWVVLLLLVFAILNNGIKWQSGKPFMDSDRKLNLFTMITAHIQLLIGLTLMFVSPKMKFVEGAENLIPRFFMMEHFGWMIVAIALITIGYVRSKRIKVDALKFKAAFIPFLIALLAILWAIPWPGRGYGGGWY